MFFTRKLQENACVFGVSRYSGIQKRAISSCCSKQQQQQKQAAADAATTSTPYPSVSETQNRKCLVTKSMMSPQGVCAFWRDEKKKTKQ